MDNPTNLPLSWAYCYQGKSMEELMSSLLCITQELEATRVAAQEEISRREDEVNHLKYLLNRTISERDEAQEKCQRLILEKLQRYETTPLHEIEEEPIRGGDSNTQISSSDCEESIVSSLVVDPIPLPPPPMLQTIELRAEKPLPEKGKLLEAVMKAGPLLEMLMLVGPLPKWRNQPPSLELFEIPPVDIPSSHHLLNQVSPICFNDIYSNCESFNKKKRSLEDCEGSDTSTNCKYPRVFLH